MTDNPSTPYRPVTSKDIAKRVGVSVSTVSRVLNGTGTDLISEDTKKRVLEASKQLGYSPNPLARALRGMQTHLLGLIVREIADPFFASFIASISTQAENLGYHIVLGHAHSDTQEAIQMSVVLDARHLDGIFVLGDLRDDDTVLRNILQRNKAVVAICHGTKTEWIPKVNIDNRIGVTLMLDHLCNLGHRRIAFIDGGWLGDLRERRDAYHEYIRTHGMDKAEIITRASTDDGTGGYQAMKEILHLTSRPTAVFASGDVIAFGAIKAAIDEGLRIPQDLSVVGFDDIEMARFFSPALTTISQPIDEMSRRALDLMFDLIAKKDITSDKIFVPVLPQLVIRQSSGPPPKGS